MVQISAAPAIPTGRVGVLVQNICGTKMIDSDLGDLRQRFPTVDVADDVPLAHHPD